MTNPGIWVRFPGAGKGYLIPLSAGSHFSLGFSWFLAVPTDKFRDGAPDRPRPLTSTSFSIRHSQTTLTFDAIWHENLRTHLKTDSRLRPGTPQTKNTEDVAYSMSITEKSV